MARTSSGSITIFDVTDGVAVRTVNLYKKNDTTLSNTTAGSFTNPTTGNTDWSLSVPSLTADNDKVYVSTRTFSEDGNNPDSSWDTPVIYSERKDGATGADAAGWDTDASYAIGDVVSYGVGSANKIYINKVDADSSINNPSSAVNNWDEFNGILNTSDGLLQTEAFKVDSITIPSVYTSLVSLAAFVPPDHIYFENNASGTLGVNTTLDAARGFSTGGTATLGEINPDWFLELISLGDTSANANRNWKDMFSTPSHNYDGQLVFAFLNVGTHINSGPTLYSQNTLSGGNRTISGGVALQVRIIARQSNGTETVIGLKKNLVNFQVEHTNAESPVPATTSRLGIALPLESPEYGYGPDINESREPWPFLTIGETPSGDSQIIAQIRGIVGKYSGTSNRMISNFNHPRTGKRQTPKDGEYWSYTYLYLYQLDFVVLGAKR